MPVAIVRRAPVARSISHTVARSSSTAMPRSPILEFEPVPTYSFDPSALAVRDLVQWWLMREGSSVTRSAGVAIPVWPGWKAKRTSAPCSAT